MRAPSRRLVLSAAACALAAGCGHPASPPPPELTHGIEDAASYIDFGPGVEDAAPFPDFFIPPDRSYVDARYPEALPDAPIPDAGPPDLPLADAAPDIGPCGAPAVIGHYDDSTHPVGNAVAVQGTIAYVAGSSLLVLDVSAPATPALIGKLVLPQTAQGIAIAGTLAYIADGSAGLYAIDVSTPSAPAALGHATLPAGSGVVAAEDVTVSGTTAYVAGVSEVVAFDVSTPSAPAVLGKTDASFAYGVALLGGGGLAVAEKGTGLFTLSTPALGPLGGPSAPVQASWVTVSGTHAYVADALDGLAVVDVSAPGTPALLGEAPLSAPALASAGDSRFAYAAEGSAGLGIVDVRAPTTPTTVTELSLGGGTALGVALDTSGHAYVADTTPALVAVALGCDR